MILFTCHGNVAKSQFAEALFIKKSSKDNISAGTNVPIQKEGLQLQDE